MPENGHGPRRGWKTAVRRRLLLCPTGDGAARTSGDVCKAKSEIPVFHPSHQWTRGGVSVRSPFCFRIPVGGAGRPDRGSNHSLLHASSHRCPVNGQAHSIVIFQYGRRVGGGVSQLRLAGGGCRCTLVGGLLDLAGRMRGVLSWRCARRRAPCGGFRRGEGARCATPAGARAGRRSRPAAERRCRGPRECAAPGGRGPPWLAGLAATLPSCVGLNPTARQGDHR